VKRVPEREREQVAENVNAPERTKPAEKAAGKSSREIPEFRQRAAGKSIRGLQQKVEKGREREIYRRKRKREQ